MTVAEQQQHNGLRDNGLIEPDACSGEDARVIRTSYRLIRMLMGSDRTRRPRGVWPGGYGEELHLGEYHPGAGVFLLSQPYPAPGEISHDPLYLDGMVGRPEDMGYDALNIVDYFMVEGNEPEFYGSAGLLRDAVLPVLYRLLALDLIVESIDE